MNHVKKLGLAAIAAVAGMAFVGAAKASADVLCTTSGEPCASTVSEVHMVNVGNVKTTTMFKTIECTGSTITTQTTGDGGAGTPVSMKVTSLTFSGCNCTVVVIANGTLSITKVAGTQKGTVGSNGVEVTKLCSSIFGNIHCIYAPLEVHLGVLTSGNDPILHIEEANDQPLPTNAVCNEKPKWDATYTVTNHASLFMTSS